MANSDVDTVVSGEWPDRMRILLGAALELAGPHDRDAVLQRIVEGAASVADARYAALGVYDDAGELTTFVHHGIDEAHRRGDRPLPAGSRAARRGDRRRSSRPPRRPELAPVVVRVPARPSCHAHVSRRADPPRRPPLREPLPHREGGWSALRRDGRGVRRRPRRLRGRRDRDHRARGVGARVELPPRSGPGHAGSCSGTSSRPRKPNGPGSAATCTTTSARPSPRSCSASAWSRIHSPVRTSLVDDARRRVADLRELVADGLRRTRQLAFDLRPTVLDDIGLVPALQRLTEDLARTGQTVELDTAALHPEERLPAEIETVIYRVVQEALTNVVRHADASTASVTVSARDERIRVFIEDDGVGFDPGHRPEQPHLGIEGMLQRAELVGGSLEITSTPGSGTVVLLEVSRG